MNLVCSNKECESHEDESYCFNVTITVGEEREIAEQRT